MSAVVVDLPLVPVMATNGECGASLRRSRQNSSTSPITSTLASFKLTGKRVFRMAPLHHHFEQKGWTEPQIVIRFWIISVMLALAGLSTLKLR